MINENKNMNNNLVEHFLKWLNKLSIIFNNFKHNFHVTFYVICFSQLIHNSFFMFNYVAFVNVYITLPS